MLLITAINLLLVGTLVIVTARKGFEAALPYAAFFLSVLPQESRIRLSGTFDLYSSRVVLVTLLLLFLAYRRKPKIRQLPLRKLIWCHVSWALLSTLFSIVLVTSTKQLIAQVLEYYLLYYMILRTITHTGTIRKIAFAMVAGMAVCSVFAVFEIYARWSILSIFPANLQLTYGTGNTLYAEMFDRGLRARSTFPHPIHFGATLAMMMPAALYLTVSSKNLWKRIFLNSSLLLMLWALYKTGSRGPWLAAACALGILTFAAGRKVRKRVLAVVVLACGVLLLRPGILETLSNMYTATMDPNTMMGSSFEYRPILFHTVMKALDADPPRAVLGYGLGSFRDKGLILDIPGIETHRWYTCDSTWILFWYETGYVGLLLLAGLLWTPAFGLLHAFRRLPKSDRYFCLVLFSSLVAFYVVMLSVAIYGWGQSGYMLWIMISLSIAYPILKREELRAASVKASECPAKAPAEPQPALYPIGRSRTQISRTGCETKAAAKLFAFRMKLV
jgi:hypothetical protein